MYNVTEELSSKVLDEDVHGEFKISCDTAFGKELSVWTDWLEGAVPNISSIMLKNWNLQAPRPLESFAV